MAAVETAAAADALILFDHVALPRPAGDGILYRADRDARTATVAFGIDIRLWPGFDRIDKTLRRAGVNGGDKIFSLCEIIEAWKIVDHVDCA